MKRGFSDLPPELMEHVTKRLKHSNAVALSRTSRAALPMLNMIWKRDVEDVARNILDALTDIQKIQKAFRAFAESLGERPFVMPVSLRGVVSPWFGRQGLRPMLKQGDEAYLTYFLDIGVARMKVWHHHRYNAFMQDMQNKGELARVVVDTIVTPEFTMGAQWFTRRGWVLSASPHTSPVVLGVLSAMFKKKPAQMVLGKSYVRNYFKTAANKAWDKYNMFS